MSVHVREDGNLDSTSSQRWSEALPLAIILLVIFLSPLIFDLSRRLPALFHGG